MDRKVSLANEEISEVTQRFQIVNVRGDGNCAFYVIMQFLYYKEGKVFQNINVFWKSIKEYTADT
jgi:hypothetical protein